MNKGYLTSSNCAESDECLTPRYAVEPIVKYLKLAGFRNILCPFDYEHSFYVRILTREGMNPIFSHKGSGEDFFALKNDYIRDFDCIVSNPPFSLKDEILTRLYEIGIPFMILLPQNALQSQIRTNLYQEYGLQYLGFDNRIHFYTKGELDKIKPNCSFACGYFCYKVLPFDLMFENIEIIQEPYGWDYEKNIEKEKEQMNLFDF